MFNAYMKKHVPAAVIELVACGDFSCCPKITQMPTGVVKITDLMDEDAGERPVSWYFYKGCEIEGLSDEESIRTAGKWRVDGTRHFESLTKACEWIDTL